MTSIRRLKPEKRMLRSQPLVADSVSGRMTGRRLLFDSRDMLPRVDDGPVDSVHGTLRGPPRRSGTGLGAVPSRGSGERRATGVDRRVAELLFDAEQLVVLRDALGAGRGAGLDLTGVGGDRQVGDRGVFGLARAVRQHGRVAAALGEGDGVEGLGQRADLVHLDEDRVGGAGLDALRETLGVRDEEVVADDLGLRADLAREVRPALPVVFVEGGLRW